MRTVVPAACLSLLAALSLACSSEGGGAPLATPEQAPPRATAPASERVPERAPERIDVAGLVATDLDEPVGGRAVTLVDALGVRHDRVTSGRGAFAVADVAAPYDLMVARGSAAAATVYLGLQRRDPYVELFERDGPTPSPARQTIRVGVRAPACGGASCRVTAVTTSPSGAGSATTACPDGEGVVVVGVDHGWRGLAVLPDERVDVHVLVGDDARAWYAYARAASVLAAPGETVDVGVVDPSPVGVTDAISVGAAAGEGALVDWAWTTSVSLDVSGDLERSDPGFVFSVAPSATTSLRLPLVPRARMSVHVAARHSRSDDGGGFHRSTEAWSEVRPVSIDAVALDVAPGPELVSPTDGGAISRRGAGFAWTASGSAGLATLTVVDRARGGARFRVLTTAREVALARIASLGLPELDLGVYVLDLATASGVGIDDATSPDADARRRGRDRTRAGGASRLRVGFRVTP
ncbi:MAG: hypothetical protein KF782_31165 [Labilithrix sp.]|nr:hypothetical protein [Labilithrix sp.]